MNVTTRFDPAPPRPVHEREGFPSEEWKLSALCRTGEQASLFIPPSITESKEDRDTREQRAKSICSVCRVIVQCRQHVLAIREPYGVWGGLTEDERREHFETGRPLAPVPKRKVRR